MVIEHLVHNERVKLTAALLNGLAVVCIASGIVQNLFVMATDATGRGGNIAFLLLFVSVGIALHLTATRRLADLKEKTTEGTA
jgi:hypothetical protein